jgi:hypothetical protein
MIHSIDPPSIVSSIGIDTPVSTVSKCAISGHIFKWT